MQWDSKMTGQDSPTHYKHGIVWLPVWLSELPEVGEGLSASSKSQAEEPGA